MTRRGAAVGPWVVAGLLAGAALARVPATVADASSGPDAVLEVLWLVPAPLFAAAGALIASRRPGNRIGWLLLLVGAGLVLDTTAGGLLPGGDSAPQAVSIVLLLVLWVNNLAWLVFVFPLFTLLYLFPTGTLPSPRWRWAPALTITMAGVLVFLVVSSTEVGPLDGRWVTKNPVGWIRPDAVTMFDAPWGAGLLLLVAGGLAAVIIRYRRASTVERTQIKFVVLAIFFFGVGYVAELISTASGGDGAWGNPATAVLFLAGVAAVPVAIAVAVLRYRLFDVDAVISRSLTYGALALFIGAVYVGIVVGAGTLLGRADGGPALTMLATAVVAIGFQPLRRRVQRAANRLVYGVRATPYEVLAGFSHRAAEATDDELVRRVPRLVVEGTGAVRATLWARADGGFHALASWPVEPEIDRMDAGAAFTDPAADSSRPIFHGGELLGGISLVKPRGEPTSPAEERLMGDLAEGLGLALRNSLLTAQLRRRVEDLERSRDRVVVVADEARRALEHDLDSGPQQQLVAVKVKLGPVRKMAEAFGAERTASLLAGIEEQAGEAIRAVRDFAAGVYPPLLEAEGLGVALGHEARRAALPISVASDGIARYPRDVESAVYFTVLEALQNTAKYAGASSASVTLRAADGVLAFEVRDDGAGFDPATVAAGAGLAGMADRMDAVGGSVAVESAPGMGTLVAGSVPVPAQPPETSRHTPSSVSMPNSDLGTKLMAPAAAATEA